MSTFEAEVSSIVNRAYKASETFNCNGENGVLPLFLNLDSSFLTSQLRTMRRITTQSPKKRSVQRNQKQQMHWQIAKANQQYACKPRNPS
ncbi:hypothetical protein [Rhizosphaericola mali]|uniref:Uncharacterized protein n=1 Tax=Rhizosphaericola mali TaxID=2545455 RepID=A0A5P2G775_9BACT|nr:hypothetical protein [Rhizosphaericola mali]QES87371.1 hypothetical protein E0W69_001415 [Rhizosphaericola mali]